MNGDRPSFEGLVFWLGFRDENILRTSEKVVLSSPENITGFESRKIFRKILFPRRIPSKILKHIKCHFKKTCQ